MIVPCTKAVLDRSGCSLDKGDSRIWLHPRMWLFLGRGWSFLG